MTDIQEVEWQLDAVDLRPVVRWLSRADDPAVAPVAGLTVQPGPTSTQTDLYVDTDDWRFHRAGFTLRMRRKGRKQAEFTLKELDTAHHDLRQRREINELLEATDPEAIREAPGPVGSRVRAVAGGRELRPLFEVRTRRRTFGIRTSEGVDGEIGLDETSIPAEDGGPPARLRRVEIEVPESLASTVGPFVDALRVSCALQPGTLSKYQLGLLTRGLSPAPDTDFGPTTVSPDDSLGDVAFAVLRQQFAVFLANEPGTRLGDDPEALHDMRVACRRLRAAMSLFREVIPVRTARLRDELGWTGRTLGEVRDLDVQMEQLDEWIQDAAESDREALAALRALLERQREDSRRRLLEALDSARYERLIRAYGRALQAGPLRRSAVSRSSVLATAPDLVEKRFRKVRKAGTAIDADSTSADYHQLRIRCKKLRYALEFLADVYPGETESLVKRLVKVQDTLGEHQDAVVAMERLRILATDPSHDLSPATVFAMGGISERYQESIGTLRKAFGPAYRQLTGKAWKDFQRLIEVRRPARAAAGPSAASTVDPAAPENPAVPAAEFSEPAPSLRPVPESPSAGTAHRDSPAV